MDRLLRVNMRTKETRFEKLRELAKYGGRGFTSMALCQEVPPTCHPLSERNKLVIATGLLGGTNAANSGRLSIGAKSPLTGGIKESNVGGNAAYKLARLGLRGIIVEEKADNGALFNLFITKDGARLVPADEFRMVKNYDFAQKTRAQAGEKVGVISIGPAGEMLLSAASIAVTDLKGNPSRHAGRGGMGAVMGSKGLKGIILDDTGAEGVKYADTSGFKDAAARFRSALQTHDVTKPGGGLSVYGTNVLTSIINEAGAFPTRNFTSGQFEGAAKISGEKMYDIIKERGGVTTHSGCSTCIIQCSNIYLDQNKNYLTSALEYETIWANGANCGINDLDAIAQIDRLCDEYGLDTIEIGCAVGVAMAGGVKEFGDTAGAIELVNEIGKGTSLGRILGNGAAITGQVFGVTDVPVVKRQGMPAYDPRAIKGIGVTYATSTMGADHTSGYAVATNILKVGGFVDPLKPEGQVELSKNLQIATAAVDSAGLCVFVAFAILDNKEGLEAIPQMINARHGWKLTVDDIMNQGIAILKAERAFNEAAGFTSVHDRLPDFFSEKKVPPHNTVFDVSGEEMDAAFRF